MATWDIISIQNDLVDYSDFEEVGSVSRAKSYITAGKRWLTIISGSASNQSSSMQRNISQVEAMVELARKFVAANDTTKTSRAGGVRFLGVGTSFR